MTGKIIQCKKCSRIFQFLGTLPYCPNCVEELESNFVLVKDYIYDHQHANVVEISKETGVPEKDIFYFLKEGRLSVSEENGMLFCEDCGCSISTGRFCESCKKKLEREFGALVNEAAQRVKQPSQKSGQSSGIGKMHINLRDR